MSLLLGEEAIEKTKQSQSETNKIREQEEKQILQRKPENGKNHEPHL